MFQRRYSNTSLFCTSLCSVDKCIKTQAFVWPIYVSKLETAIKRPIYSMEGLYYIFRKMLCRKSIYFTCSKQFSVLTGNKPSPFSKISLLLRTSLSCRFLPSVDLLLSRNSSTNQVSSLQGRYTSSFL